MALDMQAGDGVAGPQTVCFGVALLHLALVPSVSAQLKGLCMGRS